MLMHLYDYSLVIMLILLEYKFVRSPLKNDKHEKQANKQNHQTG